MGHPGRMVGMIGTIGVTVVASGHGLWLVATPLM